MGYTPLHYAASFGSTKLMDLLFEQNKMIKYCAYVKSDAYFGQLPLQIAINGKHDKAAKVLVDIMTGKRCVLANHLKGNHKHGLYHSEFTSFTVHVS